MIILPKTDLEKTKTAMMVRDEKSMAYVHDENHAKK